MAAPSLPTRKDLSIHRPICCNRGWCDILHLGRAVGVRPAIRYDEWPKRVRMRLLRLCGLRLGRVRQGAKHGSGGHGARHHGRNHRGWAGFSVTLAPSAPAPGPSWRGPAFPCRPVPPFRNGGARGPELVAIALGAGRGAEHHDGRVGRHRAVRVRLAPTAPRTSWLARSPHTSTPATLAFPRGLPLGNAVAVVPPLLFQLLIIAPIAFTVLDANLTDVRLGLKGVVSRTLRNPIIVASLTGLLLAVLPGGFPTCSSGRSHDRRRGCTAGTDHVWHVHRRAAR